jgi:hypothetical protein
VSEQPRPGDRVRITYEAEYRNGWEAVGKDGTVTYPADATVEVLTPPRCGAIEGLTGLECGLPKGHPLHEDHEATHDPETAEHDAVGYRLSVRWPWNDYDKDKPLPEWEMELLEREGAAPKPGARKPRPSSSPGWDYVAWKARQMAGQLSSPHGWEPRVFQADGPEPPEDVKALRYLDGNPSDRWPYLIHTRSGWVWAPSLDEPTTFAGAYWDTATRACPGRYEEVQP